MSIKQPLHILKRIAVRFVGKQSVALVKMVKPDGIDPRSASKFFHAIARNETRRTTKIPGVEFVIYYGEQSAVSHFEMWDPVFKKCGARYVSIFRYTNSWWPLSENENLFPISTIDQIEPLFARMPDLKAVFYPSNNGVNLQAVRNSDLRHIFLGHGDSNKTSSANKVFRLYDEVWTAGQAHVDRFSRLPGNFSNLEFRIVGQPWMQDWLQSLPDTPKESRVNWGYFPTWSGYYQNSNYSSLHIVRHLLNVVDKVTGKKLHARIKMHPWTSESDTEDVEQTLVGRDRVDMPDQSTQLREVMSDNLRFAVCDISASVTECLYLNIPIFLYKPGPPALIPKDFSTQNDFCYIFTSIAEFEALMTRVIGQGDDYLADVRAKARDYFIDMDKTREGHFYKELDELSQNPR